NLPGWLLAVPTVFAVGNTAYVSVYPDVGFELWRSDGTATGTVPLPGIGTVASILALLPQRLCFVTPASAGGSPLWSVHATAAPAVHLLDLAAGETLSPLRTIGGTVYFLVQKSGQNLALWSTDGTPAGTRAVATFAGNGGTGPAPASIQMPMETAGGRL